MNNLAIWHKQLGQHDKAADLYRSSLAIRERIYGAEHVKCALVLHNIAELLRAELRHAEAASVYHRSLAIMQVTDQPRRGGEHMPAATANRKRGRGFDSVLAKRLLLRLNRSKSSENVPPAHPRGRCPCFGNWNVYKSRSGLSGVAWATTIGRAENMPREYAGSARAIGAIGSSPTAHKQSNTTRILAQPRGGNEPALPKGERL
eukprot:1194326-Prorocentrum_minimum.AAC.6